MTPAAHGEVGDNRRPGPAAAPMGLEALKRRRDALLERLEGLERILGEGRQPRRWSLARPELALVLAALLVTLIGVATGHPLPVVLGIALLTVVLLAVIYRALRASEGSTSPCVLGANEPARQELGELRAELDDVSRRIAELDDS